MEKPSEPQAVVSTPPPPPLRLDEVSTGLSFPEAAARIGRSHYGVCEAVKRLGVGWLDFKGRRLLSAAQADYLRGHMRSYGGRRRQDAAPVDRNSTPADSACLPS